MDTAIVDRHALNIDDVVEGLLIEDFAMLLSWIPRRRSVDNNFRVDL